MKCDAGLEALARKALEVFGVEVVANAYARALTTTRAAAPDQILATGFELISVVPEDIETAKVVRGVDAAAALKLELHRLLTAH